MSPRLSSSLAVSNRFGRRCAASKHMHDLQRYYVCVHSQIADGNVQVRNPLHMVCQVATICCPSAESFFPRRDGPIVSTDDKTAVADLHGAWTPIEVHAKPATSLPASARDLAHNPAKTTCDASLEGNVAVFFVLSYASQRKIYTYL